MTAEKTLQELAGEAARWFETKTRDNGDVFVSLKDGHPEWLQELVWHAHEAGAMLPDDYRYGWSYEALEVFESVKWSLEARLQELELDELTDAV